MPIGSKSYKDGVLQGVVVSPVGESHEIRYVGPPMDLIAVAMFLNLEPVDQSQPDLTNPMIEMTDHRGGYATIQPAERASDLLHTVAELQMERKNNGDDFDPWD